MTEEEILRSVMPFKATLFAHALSILKNQSKAADCLQEVYCRLWEHRQRLDGLDNPKAYCITAVRRQAVDVLRRRRESIEGDPPPDTDSCSPNPHQLLEQRDDLRQLNLLLQSLPPRQREVVEMSGISGLSNTEIEEATGLTGDNVRVLLSRGRKKLRELFEKR